jgi:hypothetical protein
MSREASLASWRRSVTAAGCVVSWLWPSIVNLIAFPSDGQLHCQSLLPHGPPVVLPSGWSGAPHHFAVDISCSTHCPRGKSRNTLFHLRLSDRASRPILFRPLRLLDRKQRGSAMATPMDLIEGQLGDVRGRHDDRGRIRLRIHGSSEH